MLKFSKLSKFIFFKELNFQKQVNLLTYHNISILNNKVVYHSLCRLDVQKSSSVLSVQYFLRTLQN